MVSNNKTLKVILRGVRGAVDDLLDSKIAQEGGLMQGLNGGDVVPIIELGRSFPNVLDGVPTAPLIPGDGKFANNSNGDKMANKLLIGASPDNGGGMGRALKTIGNGNCYFNAAATRLWGNACNTVKEAALTYALSLRVAVVVTGLQMMDTFLFGAKYGTMYHSLDQYGASIMDVWENVVGEILPLDEDLNMTDQVARVVYLLALKEIARDGNPCNQFANAILAHVTNMNVRVYHPGQTLWLAGGAWSHRLFAPLNAANSKPVNAKNTIMMSHTFFAGDGGWDWQTNNFNNLEEFDNLYRKKRIDNADTEWRHFCLILPSKKATKMLQQEQRQLQESTSSNVVAPNSRGTAKKEAEMREKAQFEVKKREREARLCEEARLKKEADKAAARQRQEEVKRAKGEQTKTWLAAVKAQAEQREEQERARKAAEAQRREAEKLQSMTSREAARKMVKDSKSDNMTKTARLAFDAEEKKARVADGHKRRKADKAAAAEREKTAKIADRKAKREAQKARQSVSRQRVNAEQHATNHAGTAAAAAAATAAAVPLPIREVQDNYRTSTTAPASDSDRQVQANVNNQAVTGTACATPDTVGEYIQAIPVLKLASTRASDLPSERLSPSALTTPPDAETALAAQSTAGTTETNRSAAAQTSPSTHALTSGWHASNPSPPSSVCMSSDASAGSDLPADIVTDTVAIAPNVGIVAAGVDADTDAIASLASADTAALSPSADASEPLAYSSGTVEGPHRLSSMDIGCDCTAWSDVAGVQHGGTEIMYGTQDTSRLADDVMPSGQPGTSSSMMLGTDTIAADRAGVNVSTSPQHPGPPEGVSEDHVETGEPHERLHVSEGLRTSRFVHDDRGTVVDNVNLATNSTSMGATLTRASTRADVRLDFDITLYALFSGMDENETSVGAVDGTHKGGNTQEDAPTHELRAGSGRPPKNSPPAASPYDLPRRAGASANSASRNDSARSSGTTKGQGVTTSALSSMSNTRWSHRMRSFVCRNKSRLPSSGVLRWTVSTLATLVVASMASSDRNGLGWPGVYPRLDAKRKGLAIFPRQPMGVNDVQDVRVTG